MYPHFQDWATCVYSCYGAIIQRVDWHPDALNWTYSLKHFFFFPPPLKHQHRVSFRHVWNDTAAFMTGRREYGSHLPISKLTWSDYVLLIRATCRGALIESADAFLFIFSCTVCKVCSSEVKHPHTHTYTYTHVALQTNLLTYGFSKAVIWATEECRFPLSPRCSSDEL